MFTFRPMATSPSHHPYVDYFIDVLSLQLISYCPPLIIALRIVHATRRSTSRLPLPAPLSLISPHFASSLRALISEPLLLAARLLPFTSDLPPLPGSDVACSSLDAGDRISFAQDIFRQVCARGSHAHVHKAQAHMYRCICVDVRLHLLASECIGSHLMYF